MENSTRLYFALVYSMLSAILTVCMHTLKLHHMHTDVSTLLLHIATCKRWSNAICVHTLLLHNMHTDDGTVDSSC
jgi:hypothetical protein